MTTDVILDEGNILDAGNARAAREAARMSLRDVEAATGINRGLLSWWERGMFNLTDDQVRRVSAVIEQAAATPPK